MGKIAFTNGVLRVAILYCLNLGGERDVRKEAIGSNAVQIVGNKK